MKIYTLTLSPAYDVHAVCEDFEKGRENLTELTSRDAGGKGINISRALFSAGIESVPIVLLGDENSSEYESALKVSGLVPRIIRTKGRIRENLTLHHKGGETRISYKGASAPSELVDLIKHEISPAPCDILTLTGRLPEGISPSDMHPYLRSLRDMGVKLVIDSRSYSKEDICALEPWLIKPNREEIEEYIGKWINTPSELLRESEEVAKLSAENTLVTLDRDGAVLLCKSSKITLHAPVLNVISTIGAGDSAIAGFIYAHAKGLSDKEALAYAVAFGSAAALTEGTAPPKPEDIKTFFKKII